MNTYMLTIFKFLSSEYRLEDLKILEEKYVPMMKYKPRGQDFETFTVVHMPTVQVFLTARMNQT